MAPVDHIQYTLKHIETRSVQMTLIHLHLFDVSILYIFKDQVRVFDRSILINVKWRIFYWVPLCVIWSSSSVKGRQGHAVQQHGREAQLTHDKWGRRWSFLPYLHSRVVFLSFLRDKLCIFPLHKCVATSFKCFCDERPTTPCHVEFVMTDSEA